MTAKQTIGFVLWMLLLLPNNTVAQEASDPEPTASVQAESVSVPALADIIPLATELKGRLATLENKTKTGPNIEAVEKQYGQLEVDLKAFASRLQQLKDSNNYKRNKLIEFKEAIKQKNELFSTISQPLNQRVHQLDSLRKQWLTEQKNWSQWQSSQVEAQQIDQLKLIFEEAIITIDTALVIVHGELETLLTVQAKAGPIKVKIHTFITELDELIGSQRLSIMFNTSPPMFSSRYLDQFSQDLWVSLQRGIDEITLADSHFVTQQGWVILILIFLSLAVIVAVYRNRQVLKASGRWRFLAARPFSAGFFMCCIPVILLYQYEGASDIGTLAVRIIVAICVARLAGVMIETSWKRQFVYGLAIVFIITRLLDRVAFPLPLFRIYTLLTALTAFYFCIRSARQSTQHGEPRIYAGLLRLGSFLFFIIIFSELWGQTSLSSYLFLSLIHTIAAVVIVTLFIRIIHGCIEWLFHISLFRRAALLYGDTDLIISRITQFIDIAMWGLIAVPLILVIWGVYDGLEEATEGLLKLGFNWGSQRINVGLVIVVIAVFYGSFFVSWFFQKFFLDILLRKRQIQKGVRVSFERLIHYFVIFVAFLLAISILGFDLTKFTIMISALGVGIGFGLQGVVNNFVSGLILLFERPVRQGDIVEIGGVWAEVKNIGLRATTVRTFDQADLIIPNADLTTYQVTNWTLSSRQVRLIIPVGVAYGSDVPLVFEILTECAKENEKVVKTPEPMVLFLKFGESSLDFELRVWIIDTDYRLRVRSQLHQEIDRRFREANIVIAFPQRDVHLRTPNESAASKSLQVDK